MDITLNTNTSIEEPEPLYGPHQMVLDDNAELSTDVKKVNIFTFEHALGALKLLGAGAVVAAMALFLFEGIAVTNDIQRFFTILGFGAVLTAAGLAVNKLLSDRVASRLFIGLSLVSVPVIAAVLGGLVYSLMPAAQLAHYPTLATWTLASSASLWIALPLGVLVVAAISSLGIMVMARAEVRWMTPALLASAALLVIPIRESTLVALISCAAMVSLVWIVRRFQVNPISFKTLEGQLSLAVLLAAPVIMVARSVALYQPDFLMFVCISGMLYGIARYLFNSCEKNSKTQALWMIAALVTGIAAISSLTGYIDDSLKLFIPRTLMNENGSTIFNPTYRSLQDLMPIFWVTTMLIVVLDLTRKREQGGLSRSLSVIACSVAALVTVVFTVFDQSAAFVTVISALMLCAFMFNRYQSGYKFEASILLLAIVMILVNYSEWLLNVMIDTGWWGLAAGGIAAIIGGAVMEHRRGYIATPLESTS